MSETSVDMALFEENVGKAASIVRAEGRSSVSLIQHRLSVGYNYAYNVQEELVKRGIVSEANHVGRREVFPWPTGQITTG